MRLSIVTIFPEYVAPLREALLGKAIDKGIITLHVHDLRDWTHDVHKSVDDSPYGGGPGMVMKPTVWGDALDAVYPVVDQLRRATGLTTGDVEVLGASLVEALTAAVLTPAVTSTRHAGADDPTPEALIDGDPGYVGPVVLQRIWNGVDGTSYLLRCEVDDPDGNHLVLAGVLPVRAA